MKKVSIGTNGLKVGFRSDLTRHQQGYNKAILEHNSTEEDTYNVLKCVVVASMHTFLRQFSGTLTPFRSCIQNIARPFYDLSVIPNPPFSLPQPVHSGVKFQTPQAGHPFKDFLCKNILNMFYSFFLENYCQACWLYF